MHAGNVNLQAWCEHAERPKETASRYAVRPGTLGSTLVVSLLLGSVITLSDNLQSEITKPHRCSSLIFNVIVTLWLRTHAGFLANDECPRYGSPYRF